MAITKINIECTSLSTAGGEQISEKNLRKQSFKENVKFFFTISSWLNRSCILRISQAGSKGPFAFNLNC